MQSRYWLFSSTGIQASMPKLSSRMPLDILTMKEVITMDPRGRITARKAYRPTKKVASPFHRPSSTSTGRVLFPVV